MTSAEGRIVVVDDSWLILDQIRQTLSSRGYEVRTTTGADVAARLAATSDLAILDYHMPGLNGDELLAMVRRALPSTSCLFYLYTSDPAAASGYATHGFDGALMRKGDADALGPQVDAVFRTIRMRRLAERMKRSRAAV